ncbi:glycosyltransferase family 4 protein [Vibrio alginolyticus]|nr:glycosyltransferase family 4 protein [Vibrio alginolyticus]
MKKVIIIQPVVPQYRLSFFDAVNERGLVNLKVFSSATDMLGVKTCEGAFNRKYFVQLGRFRAFLKCIYWQKGVTPKIIEDVDVVVISGNPRVINHMWIFILCKLQKKKVIWWGQGWTAGSRGAGSKIRHWMMKHADGIALYTEKEESLFPQHRLAIGLNNGLDVRKIRSKLPKTTSQILDLSELHLCFIGRLTKKSGLEILLNSLFNVKRKVKLSIVGDGELRAECESISSKLCQKNNVSVIFLGAVYDEYNIGKITQVSDAFIYPGAVGLSLIHAYAHALPALVHGDSENHMPEYAAFREGVNGFSIPVEQPLLSQFIDELDILQLKKMKINALKTVEKTFNTEDMADRFLKIIKKV